MSEPQNSQQNQWSVELLGADSYIDMYANSLQISYIALENIQINYRTRKLCARSRCNGFLIEK